MSSERVHTTRLGTRLPGSGLVPQVFAAIFLLAATVLLALWLVSGAPLLAVLLLELIPVALLVRSFFVGAFLSGDAILIRGWFRAFRYGPGEIRRIEPVPYWKFLDPREPILAVLKVTPQRGWVREFSTTVAPSARSAEHIRLLERHLGVGS